MANNNLLNKNNGDNDLLKPESLDDNKNKSKDNKKKDNKKESKERDDRDKQIDTLLKRIERLEKTANKKRLDNYDRLTQENPETIFKLRMIDGKVIIRWSDLHTNKAEVDPITRRIEEDQTLTVYYEDDTKEKMDLIIFNRRYKYIYTTLVKEIKLHKEEEIKMYGNKIFVVETDDGKKYEIGEKFIN